MVEHVMDGNCWLSSPFNRSVYVCAYCASKIIRYERAFPRYSAILYAAFGSALSGIYGNTIHEKCKRRHATNEATRDGFPCNSKIIDDHRCTTWPRSRRCLCACACTAAEAVHPTRIDRSGRNQKKPIALLISIYGNLISTSILSNQSLKWGNFKTTIFSFIFSNFFKKPISSVHQNDSQLDYHFHIARLILGKIECLILII